MEDQASALIRGILPPEWIVRDVSKDYGVDLEIEIVDGGVVSGNRVWVQSKAAKQLETRQVSHAISKMRLEPEDVPDSSDGLYTAEYFPFRMQVKELEYSLLCPVPLLLFLCDLTAGEVFWLPIRDETLCSLAPETPMWRHQETATLKVPKWNSLRWEATHGFPGLRWYALEPRRLNAFVTLHHYHHEFQYRGRLSGYEIGDGEIDHGEEQELIDSLRLAREFVQGALSLDVLFGASGIDYLTTPVPGWGIPPIGFQLRDAVKAADVALEALHRETYDFMSMSLLLSKVSHALDLFSTAISGYQGFRQKFLFNEASMSWRAGLKLHGIEGAPVFPTDRQRSRGA